MQFIQFYNMRFLFTSLFVLVQFGLLDSQIRFPDESNDYRVPAAVGNRPTGGNFNNNWYARTNCQSYRYIPGYCIPLYKCNELKYSRDYNILRRSVCGFEGNVPRVCCPAQTNPGGNNGNNINPGNNGNYPNGNNPNGGDVNPPNNNNDNYPQPNPPNNNNDNYPQPNPSNINDNYGNSNVDFTYPRNLPQTCGISTKESTRVVGGFVVIPGAFPWMASLQQGKKGSRNHQCGAALVSPNLVVTASHCLIEDGKQTRPEMLSVRLGEHNIEEDVAEDAAEEYEIEQVITHPGYNKQFQNDIAVLKLKGNVRFNDRISPICLPYDSQLIRTKSLTGNKAIITGWGATSYGGSSSPTLLQANLKIVNQNFCKNAFQRYLEITDEHLCAASEDFDKDSCQGDSGGPLIMFDPNKKRYYLIGVVSFGKKCASKNTPGVYTRVGNPKILAWLNQYL